MKERQTKKSDPRTTRTRAWRGCEDHFPTNRLFRTPSYPECTPSWIGFCLGPGKRHYRRSWTQHLCFRFRDKPGVEIGSHSARAVVLPVGLQLERRTRESLITLTRPVYVLASVFVRVTYKTLFGWWEIWSQRRADASLLHDIRVNLPFLFPGATIVKERWYRVLPFDYASVSLNYGNICFCFTRGRGELNVSLSPRRASRDAHELTYVVAVLDSVNISKVTMRADLDGAADLIRPRLDALNQAFSEYGYPEFAKKL